jgi:ABC-type nitrate/sulfonate/bicarbonate transport system ATPase subunit
MINVLAGIIKARICEVKLVLMDEPLNNLDGKNKAILNRLITDLRREQPIAIVAITHCLIFEGVNRVLTLVDERPDLRRAVLAECSEDVHKECLENYY